MRNLNGALMKLMLLCAAIVLAAVPLDGSCAPASPAVPAVAAPDAMGAAPATPAPSAFPSYKMLEARYPGSDAVVIFDSLVVSFDSDNHVSKRRHRAVMLFTDNAINRYGDPRILFNAATQELTVITARVYMRDGTVVDTQKNGMNQTTPFSLDQAPDYSDWQETVVTHVGIEKGCVAELQYVIRDKASSPWLSGVEIFGAEDPTQVRAIEVHLAPSVLLKSAALNGAPPAETSSNGVWRWAVKDIPGRTPQSGGAWEGDYFPAVCYSTAKDWKSVFQTIAAGMTAASQKNDPFAPKVREAVKDLDTDENKILAIHRLELDCVSSVHAPYGLFIAAPREAPKIYGSGYASALDRAVLLAAMLKAAGYAPSWYLVSSGEAWADDVPAPEICNIIIGVPVEGRDALLLDPAAPYERNSSFTLAGRTLFACNDNACHAQAIARRSANENRSSLDLFLTKGADDTIEGEGRASLAGVFSPYYLMQGAGTEAEDFVKAAITGLFAGARLTSWNPRALERDRAELAFNFTVKLPDTKSGGRVYLTVPRPLEAALGGIDRVHLERSTCADAIKMDPCELEVTCVVEAPKGWKLIALPRQSDEKNEIGAAHVSVEPAPEGKKTCRRMLTVGGGLVRPADYAKLRSLLLAFGEDRLVLEKE